MNSPIARIISVLVILSFATQAGAVPPWKSAYLVERNRRRAVLESARSGMPGEAYRQYKKALVAQEKMLRDSYRYNGPVPAELNFRPAPQAASPRGQQPAGTQFRPDMTQSQPVRQPRLNQTASPFNPAAANTTANTNLPAGPASYRPRDIIEWRLRQAIDLLERELEGRPPQAWQQHQQNWQAQQPEPRREPQSPIASGTPAPQELPPYARMRTTPQSQYRSSYRAPLPTKAPTMTAPKVRRLPTQASSASPDVNDELVFESPLEDE
jgi:hypothetical protein